MSPKYIRQQYEMAEKRDFVNVLPVHSSASHRPIEQVGTMLPVILLDLAKHYCNQLQEIHKSHVFLAMKQNPPRRIPLVAKNIVECIHGPSFATLHNLIL